MSESQPQELQRRADAYKDIQGHIDALRSNFAVVSAAATFIVLGLVQVVYLGFEFLGLGHRAVGDEALHGFAAYLQQGAAGSPAAAAILLAFLVGTVLAALFVLDAIRHTGAGLVPVYISDRSDEGRGITIPTAPGEVRNEVKRQVNGWLAEDPTFRDLTEKEREEFRHDLIADYEVEYRIAEYDYLIASKQKEYLHIVRHQNGAVMKLKHATIALFGAGGVTLLDGLRTGTQGMPAALFYLAVIGGGVALGLAVSRRRRPESR